MLQLNLTHQCAAPNIHAEHPVLGFTLSVNETENEWFVQQIEKLLGQLKLEAHPALQADPEQDRTVAQKSALSAGVIIQDTFAQIGIRYPLFKWRLRNDQSSADFILGVEELSRSVNWIRSIIRILNQSEDPVDDLATLRAGCVSWLKGYQFDEIGLFIEEAARRNGWPTHRLLQEAPVMLIGYGQGRQMVNRTLTNRIGSISDEISENKFLTQKILEQHGIPSSQSRMVRSFRQMELAAKELGYPVVVKPLDGMLKQGVTLNVQTVDELKTAMEKASYFSRRFNVEKFIEGFDHRIVVIKGQCVAAIKKRPAQVTGDGKSSIRELMRQTNETPPLRLNTMLSLQTLEETPERSAFLQSQGIGYEDVPKMGEQVLLDNLPRLGEGGDCFDVFDTIHPANKQIAIQAADALQMEIAALDFLSPDISRPYWENGARFVEINSLPGVRSLIAPAPDLANQIGDRFINCFMGDTPTPQAEIFVYVGEGTEELAIEKYETLQGAGKISGLKTQSRLLMDNCPLSVPSNSSADHANALLWHPIAENVILQETFKDILTWGLGYETLDHLVISSIPEGQAARAALDLLAECARKSVTVNESDPNSQSWSGSLKLISNVEVKTVAL